MHIDDLKSYIKCQLEMYKKIADADKRLAVCRQAQGRIEAYEEILRIMEEGYKMI